MSIFKSATIAALVAATAIAAPLAAATSATAGERYWRDGHRNGHSGNRTIVRERVIIRDGHRHWRPHRPGVRVVRRHNDDALIAAGIGIVTGAIIAGALADREPEPQVIYRDVQPDYPPAPRIIHAPQVVSYEPWTKGWYQWCDDRYRSFNPEKGTFRGYDGRDHFCVVK
ncbi:MAG TPA: BA14K family protein [Rhizobiaceae bacterium]|nr:BA14K family protein [Rhizobiaceae bacterium]